jgi:hypothetical protein
MSALPPGLARLALAPRPAAAAPAQFWLPGRDQAAGQAV